MSDQAQCSAQVPQAPITRNVPRVGGRLSWTTLGGVFYTGIVVEMDSNVAIVELADGTRKAVEC